MQTHLLLFLLITLGSARYLLDISSPPPSPKVIVQLYYQSLCPYCKKFVVKQLSALLTYPQLFDIVDLHLYAFGNANQSRISNNYVFTCQHKQLQFQGNMLMNCAIDLLDLRTQALPFIVCLFSGSTTWQQDGKVCAQKHYISWKDLSQCAKSEKGKESMFKVGLMTKNAGINGVPYVVMNGINNTDAVSDFVEEVCEAYEGNNKPEVCGK